MLVVVRNLACAMYLLQCLQFRTEHAQDVKKVEKLVSQLMRHMVSKESKWLWVTWLIGLSVVCVCWQESNVQYYIIYYLFSATKNGQKCRFNAITQTNCQKIDERWRHVACLMFRCWAMWLIYVWVMVMYSL